MDDSDYHIINLFQNGTFRRTELQLERAAMDEALSEGSSGRSTAVGSGFVRQR